MSKQINYTHQDLCGEQSLAGVDPVALLGHQINVLGVKMDEERERNLRKDMGRRNEGKGRGRTILPGHCLPMPASSLPGMTGAPSLSTLQLVGHPEY